MKYLLTFFLCAFLISIDASFALEMRSFPKVKMSLDGYKDPIDCSIDSKADAYICKTNGEDLLLKGTDFGFLAISLNSNGELKILNPKKVETNNKILFKSTGPDLKIPNLSGHKFIERVLTVESFFEEEGANRLSGSPLFETIAKKVISKKNNLKQEYDDLFKSLNYTVELKDGQKLKCQRSKSRPLTKEETKLSGISDALLQCSAFKCDAVSADGKSYQATMVFDSSPMSSPTPSLHLTDKGSFGPDVEIKKISSSDGKQVLVDDSIATIQTQGNNRQLEAIKAIFPDKLGNDKSKIAQLKHPIFNLNYKASEKLCADSSNMASLAEAKNNLMKKVSDLELVELISVLDGGSLVGYYVDPAKAGEYGCLYNGVILDSKAQENLSLIKKNINPDFQVSQIISMEKAKELFNKAKNMKDIAWNYKKDGCYARAHLMARRFEAEGIRVDKVWIKGDLSIPESGINWNFHVAPIVYVDDGKGGSKKIVIDPSLFDKPVTVDEWDNKMTKNTAGGSKRTVFPFPENAAVYERSAISISSSDPYLPRNNIKMSEGDKMFQANSTMQEYKEMETK
jgi:hypothetical protein